MKLVHRLYDYYSVLYLIYVNYIIKAMPVHTAEVLRQIKDSGIDGHGWGGGDAWFGSVETCVAAKRCHNFDCTFVVKNNSKYFPKGPLTSVLCARYEKKTLLGSGWYSLPI